ncbi:helix-turn-helix domain-containing protein [Marinobacterium aestuariivivens]|uniref:Helix-turn-helix domain-containing protein n=1 Tax=Marinobacterium aestuariivivens TaxID=1698799 RepID=A0ABW2A914_9GAMM
MINSIPFSHNQYLNSPDYQEVQRFLNTRIDPRELRPLSRSRTGNTVVTQQSLGGSYLFGAGWSGKVQVCSGPLSGCHLIMPLTGALEVLTLGKRLEPNELLLALPGHEVDLVWQVGTTAIVATFERSVITGRHSQRELKFSAGDPAALSMFNLLHCISVQHCINSGVLSDEMQRHWERLLIQAIAEQIEAASIGIPAILPLQLKRCVDWVMDNLDGTPSVADLVKVAGCSRRSLEQGFRQFLDTSPARYICERKLERVHELLRQQPDCSIGELAFRFGFTHPSHFTKLYRERFGETPSETLSRRIVTGVGR